MIDLGLRIEGDRFDASIRFGGALVGRIHGRLHDGAPLGIAGRVSTQTILIQPGPPGRKYRRRGFAVAALAALVRALGVPAVQATRARAAALVPHGSPPGGDGVWRALARDPAFDVADGVARLRGPERTGTL